MNHSRNPDSVHAPLAAYSHQIEIEGPSQLLVLSGQVGMHPDGNIPEDPAEQLDVALQNIVRNLEAAGMGIRDLVKLTVYLTEAISSERRGAILSERLGGHAPCMTLLYVAGLATPAFKVELDAWGATERA